MRLKVSGDKSEIRQSYIPALFPHLVQPLMEQGAVRNLRIVWMRVDIYDNFQSAVEDTIEFMDEYFLTREDWDTIVELGVGDHIDGNVLKKISTATKTSFTKKCVYFNLLVQLLMLTCPQPGTTPATILLRSTRQRRSVRRPRSLRQQVLPQISKKPLM